MQARASGFGGPRADLPLTEEGQRRVEEYRALAAPERLNAAAALLILPYACQDELWYELLEMRREQLEAGEPVDARMSDVYELHEQRE